MQDKDPSLAGAAPTVLGPRAEDRDVRNETRDADRGEEALLDFLGALQAGVSDATLQKTLDLVMTWGEVLGRPEVQAFVSRLVPVLPRATAFIERLEPLLEAGLLERLADLASLYLAVADAVTPGEVEHLMQEGEALLSLANRVMTRDPANVFETGLSAAREAWTQAGRAQPSGMLRMLLSMRSDPKLRRTLGFMLALSHTLGSDAKSKAAP